jgi:hypothetical protein
MWFDSILREKRKITVTHLLTRAIRLAKLILLTPLLRIMVGPNSYAGSGHHAYRMGCGFSFTVSLRRVVALVTFPPSNERHYEFSPARSSK